MGDFLPKQRARTQDPKRSVQRRAPMAFRELKRAMARRAAACGWFQGLCAMTGGPTNRLWAWLWADRDVVLAVVQDYGWYLRYASKELRADREVVLAAVRSAGYALSCASAELRADLELVLTAMDEQSSRADSSVYSVYAAVPSELLADPQVAYFLGRMRKDPLRNRLGSILRWTCRLKTTEQYRNPWPRSYIAMKFSLARDRDALGAAIGVRDHPALHTALNGAPEALALVHHLIAQRVRAMSAALTLQNKDMYMFFAFCRPGCDDVGRNSRGWLEDESACSLRDDIML